jgi:hypothetical protein
MLQGWAIGAVSFAYLCVLFAIAYWGDKQADRGRSIITPAVYSLSIAVYCTSWTYYGSVGLAAYQGIGFLPIYLGPTLAFVLSWFLLRKIVRISRQHRITSIADFVSSRYGKSALLSGLVTVIAVVGIMPYISLQLKAVSVSFNVLTQYPAVAMPQTAGLEPMLQDSAFYVAAILAVFTILFGTRHIDVSEHHQGMVAAVAFESIVKLVAFLAVGVYATFVLHEGLGDIFARALADERLRGLFSVSPPGDVGPAGTMLRWMTLTLMSMAAIVCLPRQFQVAVVENIRESHLTTAVWLFPLYLLAINLFVLPIAFAGVLTFGDGAVDADTFVLTLPMAGQEQALALFAFIGGLSAATGMVIVATIALSTMVCNDLIMPVLLRLHLLRARRHADLAGLLLGIRRGSIVLIILLGYVYFRYIGESYALVSIGLVSFAAATQFAPAIVGGMFWRRGTAKGALAGLSLGFLVWAYTLLLPSMAQSGWIGEALLIEGPFAVGLLRPYALFGLEGLDPYTHALFWSLLANAGSYVAVSLATRQDAIERVQAVAFVDVFRPASAESQRFWRGDAKVAELLDLTGRYLGHARARRLFANYARRHGMALDEDSRADHETIAFAERMLAGAIGGASARVVVASAIKGEALGIDRVMAILDEATQIREYSRRLEQKSRELEATTAELTEANERLKELDRLKDDFIATVSHELRTPLTSIRSFSEILRDAPDIEPEQRREFLEIVVKETERLTRLINEILDLAKLEAGRMDWHVAALDPGAVIGEAVDATRGLARENRVALEVRAPPGLPAVLADRDRLIQVLINLISNAVRHADRADGRVEVAARLDGAWLTVDVSDNGPGVPEEARALIFDKFQQIGSALTGKPQGTGLGLAISRQIIQHFGGDIWIDEAPGGGARFCFTVPLAEAAPARRAG